MTNLSAICSTVILGSLNKALATVISSSEGRLGQPPNRALALAEARPTTFCPRIMLRSI